MKLSFYTIKQYENTGNTVPDYVKTASVDELSNNRLDSRANVWMHALNYYTTDDPQQKTSIETIKKHAKYFGNDKDVEAIATTFNKIASESVNPDDYVISGNGINAYPVRSRAEWEAAYSFLKKNANALPKKFKTKMAAKLLKKADAYLISVQDEHSLLKYASLGLPLDDSVIAQLYRRSEMLNEPSLVKLAETIDANPESLTNQEFCDNLVDFIQEVDGKYAEFVPNFYNEFILPPDDAVYTVSIKQAADLVNDMVKMKTGTVYSKDQLADITYNDISSLFGESVADDVSSGIAIDVDKLADVLAELPLPDASSFDEFMQSKEQPA